MLRLKAGQRQMLVDKVPDFANLVIGALFLGQFLGDGPFSLALALFGIAAWTVLTVFALAVAAMED